MYARRQRRTVVDGRLQSTRQALTPLKVSRLRCLVVCAVVAALLVTNPANRPFLEDHLPFLSSKTTRSKSAWYSLTKMTTNYLFFTVKEDVLTKITFQGLLLELDCPYNDSDFGYFCETLGDELSHQKPVLLDASDLPYSAHRVLSWTFVACFIVSLCLDNGLLYTRSLLMDATLQILMPSPDYPLFSLAAALVESTTVVYPTLQRMEQLVAQQARNSWFRPTEYHETNFWFSALTLFVLAACMNALTFLVAKRFVLGRQAFHAVALGYFRGAFPNVDTSPLLYFPLISANFGMKPVAVTWVILITMALFESIPVALCWLAANTAGKLLGSYQLENQLVIVMARSIVDTFEDMKRFLFTGFR